MKLNLPTPLEKFIWRGHRFYIKRDDLLHEFCNGNKARKFFSLINSDLKDKTLISFGGNQSNAMLSLAYIAFFKKIKFIYITPSISSYLQENLVGNFLNAKNLSTEFVYCQKGSRIEDLQKKAIEIYQQNKNSIFIPQGGNFILAKEGIKILAQELLEDMKDLNSPIIFYVSGSGSSAGYLSEFIDNVFTIGVSGDDEYLKKIFSEMNLKNPPKILPLKSKPYFGKPDLRLKKIYEEWLELGIEFDLIYDILGWLCLYENIEYFRSNDIVFIHSGGTSGNASQMLRYENLVKKNL